MIVTAKRWKTDRCPVYDSMIKVHDNVTTPEVTDSIERRISQHVTECPACKARQAEADNIARNAVHPPLERMTADEVKDMAGYDIPDDLKPKVEYETW